MSCRLDSGTGRERLGNRNSGATYSRCLFFSLFITSRNYLAGNSGVDDANDVWIYHRKDHIKQPRSRKSYAVPFHRSEYIPSISSSIAEPNRPEQDGLFRHGRSPNCRLDLVSSVDATRRVVETRISNRPSRIA